ncbi:gene transfer agent family protein [Prosthecomicrobium sp. N25]|uniref:gene transfer agent family protein n=1 Tax=Prosthecomicrobium sp. N25 TaxID=3129254 RepID=UPI003077B9DC
MANPRRGEVEAVIDGRPRTLCLTLGALAELEAAFGVDDLAALAARFGSGRLSARDIMRILAAGLRGAGEAVGDEDAGRLRVEGGLLGAADLAGRLLVATFGRAEDPARGPFDPSPSPGTPP